MDRIIFHIDVNNAFLSWTAIDMLKHGCKIDVRNTVSVIGDSKEKRSGIVLAKSILAKKVGIVSAETLYSAKKKYSDLKVYSPNYKLYEQMSYSLFSLLKKISPDIEIASIDECYLDYGKVKNIYGDEILFAYRLKNKIKNELGFTVNIGIANNKLCAKMASDFLKPDKVHTLYDYEIKSKMWCLPIGDLFGVGKQTAEKLINIGIKTIGDLANYDSYRLSKYFKNYYRQLIEKANGIDNIEVDSSTYIPKGISNEITLIEDASTKEELYPYLYELSNKTAKRIRDEHKYASVICIILKDNYFHRKNHQKKIKNPTNSGKEIYEISKQLLNDIWDNDIIRLVGIRLDSFTQDNSYQMSLFDNVDRKKEEKVDIIIDDLNKKFGKNIIKKGVVK